MNVSTRADKEKQDEQKRSEVEEGRLRAPKDAEISIVCSNSSGRSGGTLPSLFTVSVVRPQVMNVGSERRPIRPVPVASGDVSITANSRS